VRYHLDQFSTFKEMANLCPTDEERFGDFFNGHGEYASVPLRICYPHALPTWKKYYGLGFLIYVASIRQITEAFA